MIFNDSTRRVQVKFGSTSSPVTSTSFTLRLIGAEYYEMPEPLWVGAITARTTSATASLKITEMT